MNTDIVAHDSLHLLGDSATTVMALLRRRLAALLLLVGKGAPRRRVLPATLGASNCRS